MTRRKSTDRPRRFAPSCEGLELRALPSSTSLVASGALASAARNASGAAGGSASDVSFSIPLFYRPFVAKSQGPVIVGAPRNLGLRSQTYMFGSGNSSAMLHFDMQMAYFTPSDPAQPLYGQAVLVDKNVSNTGNGLTLNLTAVPGAVDRHGRPTLFTWTQDATSGGTFTSGEGTGTAQLIYSPGKFPGQQNVRGAAGAGHVGVIFRGTIGITNLNSTLRNE